MALKPSDIGINNIPFCYKGTDEVDFFVNFPSVNSTKEKLVSYGGPGIYYITASDYNTTTINKTISAPYIFCNGIFVARGETKRVRLTSLPTLKNEYYISYNSNNITLKTSANYGKTSNTTESGTVTLNADAWKVEIKPCQGQVDKINFNGDSVNMLKYGNNIVWLKKIEPVIIRK